MGLKVRAIDRSDCTTFMGFCARLTGATSRLVTGNGGVTGLKIRAIDRSDLYNFMGFCKADRGDQSTEFMRDNFETFKT